MIPLGTSLARAPDGFHFTRDLCRAIELFTADAVNSACEAFVHDGLDLRYAVERYLYIRCANSAQLMGFYAALCTSDESCNRLAGQLDWHDAQLARFLPVACGLETGAAPAAVSGRGRLTVFMRWAYQWWKAMRRVRPQGAGASALKDAEVLIYIAHQKFADYLAPVTRALGASRHAYLEPPDAAVGSALRSRGVHVVPAPTVGPRWRDLGVTPLLREFPALVDQAAVLRAAVQVQRPHCVLVVEGNAPGDSIMAEVCSAAGVPCFCLQQGWSPFVHTGFRNFRFKEMWVWGQGFADLLQPYSPGQSFVVTGHPSLAREAHAPAPAPPVQAAASFFLQAPCPFLSQGGYNAFLQLAADCAHAYPQLVFAVREHPSYPLPASWRALLEAAGNVVISDPAKERVAQCIASSSLVVSVFSTVLLEALPLGVVSLVCSIGSLPRYEPAISGEGAAIEVYTVEQARQAIDAAIANPQAMDPLRAALPAVAQRYFARGDGASFVAHRLLATRDMTA